MENNKYFHLADVKNDKKSLQLLTEFENKLGEQIGGDVVLIAYKRDDA